MVPKPFTPLVLRKRFTPERQRAFAQRCYAPIDVYLQLGIFYPTYAGSM
jgi:hypothetical protein